MKTEHKKENFEAASVESPRASHSEQTGKPTWKELEAQGVKRCCAMFKDGTQCRRRVSPNFDSWCDKHGPTMKLWEDYNLKLIEVSKHARKRL